VLIHRLAYIASQARRRDDTAVSRSSQAIPFFLLVKATQHLFTCDLSAPVT
jgi:hypothetical protein